MLTLMTTQVGVVKCSRESAFPHKLWSNTLRSTDIVFPQGTSPKFAYMYQTSLLGKSVFSGLVMTIVAQTRAVRITRLRANFNIDIDIIAVAMNQSINIVRMEIFINALMRPYRSTYTTNDLGLKKTDQYIRTDSEINNDRDMTLKYSYYEHRVPSQICVIYCHCNSGSRIEGIQYLESFVQKGWNVCLFDFSGSGQSEGSHISLGHFESRDLQIIVNRMRVKGNRQFVLWGRSMGAATIILYLSQAKYREDICGCVLDSPYSSLWSLIKRLGQQRSILPGFILQPIIDYLRERIREDYLIDIKQLQPIKCMSSIDIPTMFITSQMDEFVKSQDVVQLYKQCASRNKHLEYIDKAHNSSRDQQTIRFGANFLSKTLQEKVKKKQYKAFSKKMTGGNMAELILRAEKEKCQLKRIKSQLQLNKENRDKNAKESVEKHHNRKQERKEPNRKQKMYTEMTSNPSMVLGQRDENRLNRTFIDKKKAIKCSIAHIELNKKVNRIVHKPKLQSDGLSIK